MQITHEAKMFSRNSKYGLDQLTAVAKWSIREEGYVILDSRIPISFNANVIQTNKWFVAF